MIILILIQKFFYLAALNGLYIQHGLYSRLSPHRMVIMRDIISLLYCLVGSLCTTGAIWAFRAGWSVDGRQYVLSWMVLWLFAHINFLQLDVFTIWLPPPYISMALISWIVFNVASIILPFELSPGFYRIGYAAPAHEVYQTLIDIWSRGCNPQLYYALPILFVWWIWGIVMSGLGVYRRSHYALLKEQEEARQFQERLDIGMKFERQREKEFQEKSRRTMASQDGPYITTPVDEVQEQQSSEPEPATGEKDETDEPAMRAELAAAITREDNRIRREQSREDNICSFGPAFTLPFGRTAELDQEQ